VAPSLHESLSYVPTELAFGTSGLRGLVRDITSLEAYINTTAFLRFCLERGDVHPRESVCVAGDLRPSTTSLVPEADGRGEILQAVARAISDAGLEVEHLGHIPSPALMLYAGRRHRASVMVTGSHIPFDRNGIKFNKVGGEVLKADETPILEHVRRFRAEAYTRPFDQTIFDERGMLKPELRSALPAPVAAGHEEYLHRYLDAFPPEFLAGRRILVWQHSAVGRDIMVEILSALGAEVIPAGRSEAFVAVDTEAVSQSTLELVQGLVHSVGGGRIDAAVSTDGDSDRPLVMGVERGKLAFYPGDLLGLVTADFLGARHVAVPISVNDAVDAHLGIRDVRVVKTRIGSPHVITAMREVGWEANGGFLTAHRLRVPGGGALVPLPTRDAMLPILAALCASLGRGQSLGELFARLPLRFSSSTVLRHFPPERSAAVMRIFAPPPGIEEASFSGGSSRAAPDAERQALDLVRTTLESFFVPGDGFGSVAWVNWLDGVRVCFSGGDIVHIRPSGNAPELRVYAVADTPERARRITELGAGENGIIWKILREVVR
jgi:phosphomannomutase